MWLSSPYLKNHTVKVPSSDVFHSLPAHLRRSHSRAETPSTARGQKLDGPSTHPTAGSLLQGIF